MNRHSKRNGITAFKFVVEVHMTKVDLKLAQQCRISVIFKRGPHKKETINAPVLEKGVAYFDEKVSAPAIFYYDEQKGIFLAKEATLALNMISAKNQRLIGITKFDLSTYLNKNTKDTNVELKMDKCLDKAAKFHFRLKMTQLSEVDPCTNFRDDEETSHVLDDNSRSPSRIYFEEKSADLSGIAHADNSDIADDHPHSPKAVSVDALPDKNQRTSRRLMGQNLESDNSMDEKLSSGKKGQSSSRTPREKTSPLPMKDMNIQKSKTAGAKVKDVKQHQVVEDTPRWSDNVVHKIESPFNTKKDYLKNSPPLPEEREPRREASPEFLIENERKLDIKPFANPLDERDQREDAESYRRNDYRQENRQEEFERVRGTSPDFPYRFEERTTVKSAPLPIDERGQTTGGTPLSNRNNDYREYALNSASPKADFERNREAYPDYPIRDDERSDIKTPILPGEKGNQIEEVNLDSIEPKAFSRQGYQRISFEPINRGEDKLDVKSPSSSLKQTDQQSLLNYNDRNEDKMGISDRQEVEQTKQAVQTIEEATQTEGEAPKVTDEVQTDLEAPKVTDEAQTDFEAPKVTDEVQTDLEIPERDKKIAELESQVWTYEQNIKELQEQLQFSNGEYFLLRKDYEELKEHYDQLFVDFQNLQQRTEKNLPVDKKNEKRADFEVGIYKEKVASLQKELDELKSQKIPHSLKSEGLEEITEVEVTEGIPKSTSDKFDTPKIEEYKTTVNQLRHETKELKKKLNDAQTAYAKEMEKNKITVAELTGGINKLRKENEQKDQKIDNLETYIRDVEDEMQFMKAQEGKTKAQEDNSQIKEVKMVAANISGANEDSYRQTITDLTLQNLNLKKELDQVKKILSLNQIEEEEHHHESPKSINFENREDGEEDVEAKVNQLEVENNRLAGELKKTKMGWAAADLERYNLMNLVKENQEQGKGKDDRIDYLEIELFKLKTRLADIINNVMELGSEELLDKVEEVVSLDRAVKRMSQAKTKSVLS